MMFRFWKRLQNRFHKQPAPAPAVRESKPLSEFEHAAKHRCEVRGMDDRPIFLADVKGYDGHSFLLYPALDIDAPPVIFNSQYKLVFRTLQRPAPAWAARVRGSNYEFWKMDELSRQPDEQRASFRQRLSPLPAAVIRVLLELPKRGEALGEQCFSGEQADCEVLDVGVGGLQLRSSEPFFKNELVAVTGLLLGRDPNPFSLPLQVRWVADSGDGFYHCGCAFHAVPERDEQRLCAAMFGLQRTSLNRI